MSENLNEAFEETMYDATVITVPIDTTLTQSGEAADAAAVGAALALKADASQVVTISVNGESPDQQGEILLDASEIPISDASEADSVAEVIGGMQTDLGNTVRITEQTLESEDQAQARANINAADADELTTLSGKVVKYIKSYSRAYEIAANGDVTITASQLGTSSPPSGGYIPVGVAAWNTGSPDVLVRGLSAIDTTAGNNVVWLHNTASSAKSGTFNISVLYLKF